MPSDELKQAMENQRLMSVHLQAEQDQMEAEFLALHAKLEELVRQLKQ